MSRRESLKRFMTFGLCTLLLLGTLVQTSVTPLNAASDNRVTAVQKVKKDTELKDGTEPQLVIKLEDDFTKNNSFYLELKNALWLADGTNPSEKIKVESGVEGAEFEIERQGNNLLRITFKGGTYTAQEDDGMGGTTSVQKDVTLIPAGKSLKINLRTKVLKGEAVVVVDGDSTVISSSEETFALVDTSGVRVSVSEVPVFAEEGEVAPITIEESYTGAFLSNTETVDGKAYAVFKMIIDNSDFEFANLNTIKIKPIKGFSSVSASEVKIKELDYDEIEFRILEDTIKNKEKGGFTITGIEVESAVDGPDEGDLPFTIEGNFMKTVDVVVAKIASYTLSTKVTAVDKEFKDSLIAGRQGMYKVEFKESIKDTLSNGRELTFELEDGYMLDADTRSRSGAMAILAKNVKLGTGLKLTDVMLNDTLVVGFAVEVSSQNDDIDEYDVTFPVTAGLDMINIFAEERLSTADKATSTDDEDDESGDTTINFGGGSTKDEKATVINYKEDVKKESKSTKAEIKLVISGRAISNEEIETKIASVVKPIDVKLKEVKIKTGLKDQKGSDITLTETQPSMIRKGEIIFMFDNVDGLSFSKPPKVEVTSGDLRLGKGELVRSGNSIKGVSFEIVKPSRKEASTIVLSDILITADRTVPEGDTGILLSGDALLQSGQPVASKYYAHVATVNTEDQINTIPKPQVTPNKKEIEAVFRIDDRNYTVNGQSKQMDAAPYASNNRTMMPVRYVADAFGISDSQMLYQGSIITLLTDTKTIQMKIGSNVMLVNGAQIPMDTKTASKDNRTYVPVAYIASALGIHSHYDAATRTVTFNNVTDPKTKLSTPTSNNGTLTQDKPATEDLFNSNEAEGYYSGNW